MHEHMGCVSKEMKAVKENQRITSAGFTQTAQSCGKINDLEGQQKAFNLNQKEEREEKWNKESKSCEII